MEETYENIHQKYKEILKGYYGNGCSICCGYGWLEIIDNCLKDIESDLLKIDAVVVDIKEKYGTLRIYVSSGTDYVFGRIDMAEGDSNYICELCGEEGKLRDINGWYSTLCDEHAQARKDIDLYG